MNLTSGCTAMVDAADIIFILVTVLHQDFCHLASLAYYNIIDCYILH